MDSQPAFQSIQADELSNVAQLLSLAANQVPDHVAVAVAKKRSGPNSFHWDTITYSQLNERAFKIANGLIASGIPPQTRLALLVKPGIDFIAIVFGLMKAGMVQILIDPGMGRKHMIKCLSDAKPEGFVAIPAAHAVRCVLRNRFPLAKHNVTVGRRWFWGGKTLKQIEELGFHSDLSIPETTQQSNAAIIFTTGSTGPPKGVAYSHKMFIGQATQIRDHYNIQPGGADLSGFPLFALFNVGMGMTTIIPKMDPTKPAEVDPRNIIDAVNHWKANQSFGSPALWNTVSTYCEKHNISLPSVKRVFSAGAPVPPHVLKRVKGMIAQDGIIHTPYGATESLPVASNDSETILSETAEKTDQGLGTCVGHKFPGVQWKVIQISDQPIQRIDQVIEVPAGSIGEIMVKGPVVSQNYLTRSDANELHKVTDGNEVWHRIGDVGYLDSQQRFWFCGRKGHRLSFIDPEANSQPLGPEGNENTMFTVPVEAMFNTHKSVYRSALVGPKFGGKITPIIIVEPWPKDFPQTEAAKSELENQLLNLALKSKTTSRIKNVLIIKKMPTDIRHNSKIFREKLTPWAQKQLEGKLS